MKRRDTVVLFVKQPALGRVKTRLAGAIGAVAARRTYETLTRLTIRRLRQGPWRVVLAVTPDRARWRGWPRGLVRVGQGRGDLGQRMGRALRAQARLRAVLIGSDIPTLDGPAIMRAFAALGRSRFAFGPAEDGGYWLIGWRRGAWPHGALRGVRWSTADALRDSCASLPRGMDVTLVDRRADLDDAVSYEAWCRRGGRSAVR